MTHPTGFPEFPGHQWADGCIYYILSGENGRIKIGFTKGDPGKRLRALKTGSSTRIGIVAVHPGTQELERQLHERFAADHAHGEWFEMSDATLLHLAETFSLSRGLFAIAGEPVPQWVEAGENALRQICAEAEMEGATLQ